MIALIFILLLVAVLLAWRGYRKASIYCFAITLILAIFDFLHHITDPLTIQL